MNSTMLLFFNTFIALVVILSFVYQESLKKKKVLENLKSNDFDPKSFLSLRAIQMVKGGQDDKAIKRIKKETGLSLKDSKDILIKVKWHLTKTSE